jgi:hypothetical protein
MSGRLVVVVVVVVVLVTFVLNRGSGVVVDCDDLVNGSLNT